MRRRSIDIAEFHHGDAPIPVACRVDNIVHTGAISGYDASSGTYAEGVDAQAALMFSHLRQVLRSAGAAPEDVVRMTFYAPSREARPAINRQWVEMFPDPGSRPARHILAYDTPPGALMQCDALAVIAPDRLRPAE